MIESRELWLVETLNDGHYSGVNKPKIRVRITFAEVSHTTIVIGQKIFDPIRSAYDVLQEDQQNTCMKPLPDPVVHLKQHRSRDHEWLCGLFDQAPRTRVGGISTVQRRVQRPGVRD